MEDLEAFLSPEQAREAFDLLDNNGDGKLVLADIRDAVIKIYKERRNLALSLKVPFLAAVCSADRVCLDSKCTTHMIVLQSPIVNGLCHVVRIPRLWLANWRWSLVLYCTSSSSSSTSWSSM